MKTYRFAIVISVIALFICASQAEAVNIRGRLDRGMNAGVYPAVGIPVTVSSPRTGRSYAAYTDKYGFYYLYNIPPGNYNLEVWVTNPPRIWRVQVPLVSQFDIYPIRIQ